MWGSKLGFGTFDIHEDAAHMMRDGPLAAASSHRELPEQESQSKSGRQLEAKVMRWSLTMAKYCRK